MTEAQRAHIRLLHSIPRECVRTHERNYGVERQYGTRVGKITEELIVEVKALQDQGLSQRDLLIRLSMGAKLYRRIQRAILDRTSLEQRREQIRALLALRKSTRTIAAIVGMSRTAVKKHKRQLQRETARASDSRYADIPTL